MSQFLLCFLVNLVSTIVLVRLIYYPANHNKGYVFSFISFSSVIFFILTFMGSTDLSVGVGFGLFAIFGVLRYRTDPIPIREMTYLFVVISLPIINASGLNTEGLWAEIIGANALLLVVIYALEKEWGFKFECKKNITYERIELIVPERRAELVADLRMRTGLNIARVEIGAVDFMHDTAKVTVYYDNPTDTWDETSPDMVAKSDDDDD